MMDKKALKKLMADFFNPCCLTSPIAQIVELRAAYPAHTQHLNARQTFAINW
ncbi:hypothetical protein HMPREF1434_01655 [Helicobacter pylori GAMchJs124i]|nr:hypothetical protein HMPREF1434_01655 [Helicobacter pylori GAMchJs124i]